MKKRRMSSPKKLERSNDSAGYLRRVTRYALKETLYVFPMMNAVSKTGMFTSTPGFPLSRLILVLLLFRGRLAPAPPCIDSRKYDIAQEPTYHTSTPRMSNLTPSSESGSFPKV